MGIVTSISGGAGVFGIPIMLAFGLPPVNVLALNRVSDVGTVFGALRKYHASKGIDWRLAAIIAVPMAIGSFIGASAVIRLPEETLRYVIIAGIGVGIFFLLRKAKPKAAQGNRLSWIGLGLMLIVGVWSGALAMAGATFAVLVLVYFFNKTFLQARSTDIAAAIPETLVSSAILIGASTVSAFALATMFVSSFIGAWIGSHLAVKHGNEFIRKAMVSVALVMVIKVIVDIMG